MPHNCCVKRSIVGAVLTASLLLAPLAYAQTEAVPIGDPFTDTLQLWSGIAGALSSLGSDLASLFSGQEFAVKSTTAPNPPASQREPASLAAAAALSANPEQTTTSTRTPDATSDPTTLSQNVKSVLAAPSNATTGVLIAPNPSTFVTQTQFNAALSQLGASVRQLLAETNTTPTPQYVAADGNPDVPYAGLSNIGQLSNVTITNANLTASEIPALDYLSLSGGTLTGTLSVPTLSASSTSYGVLTATNASTTLLSNFGTAYFGGTATTTIDSAGNLVVAGNTTLANATTTNLAVTGTASTSNLVASTGFTFKNVTGFLKATAGAVATSLINLASDVTGILPVANGGTGWANIAAGVIPYGSGSGALATTTAGTAGYILAYLNGVPTWTATTTLANISGTLAVSSGGTGQNSSTWNGLAAVNAGVWSALSTTSMNANITGNAGTATALQNAQTINSVSFNGTAGITITAASSTILSDNNTFTGANAFGNATTTNLFSTTASSTSLFSQTASLGSLTLTNALAIANGGTGSSSFGQGWLYSSGGTGALAASTSPTVNYIVATSTTATSTIAGGLAVNLSGLVYNWATGFVGVGTANPSRLLNVFSTTANPQLRISYNSSSYTELQTDAAGDFLVAPTSGIVEIANGNIEVCSNSVCSTPTIALSGAGNIEVLNRLIAGSLEETCPSGFIWVPGESKYGTLPGFCTMKYDASQSGSVAVSVPSGSPWVSISQTSAIAQCEARGPGYHLMSEPEWMTIASEITSLPINDMTGSQQFSTGHSDNNTGALTAGDAGTDPVVSGCNWMKPLSDASNAFVSGVCEERGNGSGGSTDADKGFYGTGSTFSGGYTSGSAGASQLRTFVLPSGAVIWDMAGNVWQWTDATIYESNTAGASATSEEPDAGSWTSSNWYQYTSITNYKGLNYIRPDITTWSTTNGIGEIYLQTGAPGYYAFIRGGGWGGGSDGGVFSLLLNVAPSDAYNFIGFRCSR
jgi:hypothetical protein